MSVPLSELGRSLATSYYDELSRWSLPGLNSMPAELDISFGLAEDIARFEEEWLSFATLIHALQTDTIPQDLLAITDPAAQQHEEQQLPVPYTGGAGKDPFISSSSSGLKPSAFDPPAESKWQEEMKAADHLNTDISGSVPGSPDKYSNSSLGTHAGELPSAFHQNSAKAVSDLAFSKFEFLDPSSAIVPGELHVPIPPSWNHRVKPEDHTSPKVDTPKTPELPDASSDSIWTQPLNNLGDMATLFVHPGTEASSLSSTPANIQIADVPTYSNPQELNSKDGNELSLQPENMPWQKAPGHHPEMLQASGWQEDFLRIVQTPGSAILVPLTDLETPNVPHTDDLLDALTERVIRDFRRYYP